MSEALPNCLIIDDDPGTRRLLERILQEIEGVRPVGLPSPSAAMDYRSQNPHIGVILIDWHLEETDGLQWIEPLHREWPAAAFICMSSDTDVKAQAFLATHVLPRETLWWRKTDSVAVLGSLVDLAFELHERRVSGRAFRTLDEIRDTAIRGAVANHAGDLKAAARELGVSESTIRRHMRAS